MFPKSKRKAAPRIHLKDVRASAAAAYIGGIGTKEHDAVVDLWKDDAEAPEPLRRRANAVVTRSDNRLREKGLPPRLPPIQRGQIVKFLARGRPMI